MFYNINGNNEYNRWLDNHKCVLYNKPDWNNALSLCEQEVKKTSVIQAPAGKNLNTVIVPLSDIEGRPVVFLVKLKQANVIKGVEIDKQTQKIKINLNPNFHGTIDFCGDLTSYKLGVPMYGNEILIELFEELLHQIKEHNKGKDKDKQIQFVAVPGNHEFFNFWGDTDNPTILNMMCCQNNVNAGDALLVKLRALKIIADIQKYFLQQVKENGEEDDIIDDDYGDDYGDDDPTIDNKIKKLRSESEELSEKINDIINAKKQGVILPNEMWNEIGYIQGIYTQNHYSLDGTYDIKTLKKLNWKYSNLLPKIVFCHNGKKFRTLHSFSLFTPKEYVSCNSKLKKYEARIGASQQKDIFSQAFKNKTFNTIGINFKDIPDKRVFSENKIPTIVGHEGSKRCKNEIGKYTNTLKPQSEQVFCIDESNFAPSGYTHIIYDDNRIQGYAAYKGKNQYEIDQGVSIGTDRKQGEAIKDESQQMRDCAVFDDNKAKQRINGYITTGKASNIVSAINFLHNNNSNFNFDGLHNLISFSESAKRSEQIYRTFLEVNNNNLNKDRVKQLYNLNDIGIFNCMWCGGLE